MQSAFSLCLHTAMLIRQRTFRKRTLITSFPDTLRTRLPFDPAILT